MSTPSSGPYRISQPNDNLLTMQDNLVGSPISILTPTGNPEEQDWHLQNEGGSITLKNLKHNLYAGVEENNEPGAPVVGVAAPFKWKLKAAEPSKFLLYVDGADEPLYLDYSLLKAFPPRTALSPQPGTPWTLQRVE
ncbi:unnamed protein product [Rhizoctonia solani]|uniref:Ricin B lectin domain-containing protein n=1 Tax=Rhizoctonia solani TaxID=456999 RepID=A0A8H3GYR9_9AGAM|nr:unnamed protein product [Rhizoctonia solani]